MSDSFLPLFVYGTLMSDQPAFDLLVGTIVRSAPATIRGLAMYNVGRYPLAVAGAPESQIVGELHWLQSAGYAERLAELEAYEGPEYRLATRWADCPTVSVERTQALVFIGQAEYAARLPLIPHGDWRAWIGG